MWLRFAAARQRYRAALGTAPTVAAAVTRAQPAIPSWVTRVHPSGQESSELEVSAGLVSYRYGELKSVQLAREMPR